MSLGLYWLQCFYDWCSFLPSQIISIWWMFFLNSLWLNSILSLTVCILEWQHTETIRWHAVEKCELPWEVTSYLTGQRSRGLTAGCVFWHETSVLALMNESGMIGRKQISCSILNCVSYWRSLSWFLLNVYLALHQWYSEVEFGGHFSKLKCDIKSLQ